MRIDGEDPSAPEGGEQEYDVFARTCPSRPTLEHITGRWGALVLGALNDGPLRFNELGRRVDGVSQKMLSQTVHALERDGFVEREVMGTIPPHVEYSLTPIGRHTSKILVDLFSHLEGHMPNVLEARRRYDEQRRA
ncbi:winged helix-turn-helix transcriptional regulator [Agromyces binzhouensis]|uniref:winged helix-turn-helix transcriptional regulator n=1 Tax=Agromyces binzhouensis TaxID=1817495 RepID=UPI00363C176F